jgi:hypothetical protein
MKIIKNILFILSVVVLLVTCNKSETTSVDLIYQGHVYHSSSGTPASGIVVVLSACDFHTSADKMHICDCNTFNIGKSTTDTLGHFYIKGKEARSDHYFVGFNGGTDPNCTNKVGLSSPGCTSLTIQ